MRVENLAHTLTRGHCTRAKFNALSLNFDAAANAIAELNNFFSGCCNECRLVRLLIIIIFSVFKKEDQSHKARKKRRSTEQLF